MTDDDLPPLDWHNPIPGNPQAIQGEIDRVTNLRDCCGAGEKQIRNVTIDTWQGTAASEFETFRSRWARQWTNAYDEYDRWSGTLVEYREILVTTQALARNAIAEATSDHDWARARTTINTLRAQHSAAASRAANVIDDVARGLRLLPRLLDTPNTDGSATRRQSITSGGNPGETAQRTTIAHRPADEPTPIEQSPAELYRRAKSLCDAVLDATFVSAETLC
jgi:uncharacterized protein YukE